jgi:hypothetical protein
MADITEQDNFRPNIDPKITGGPQWVSLYAQLEGMSKMLSDRQLEAFKAEMNSLAVLFPCAACRAHITTYNAEHLPELNSSKNSILLFLDNMRNAIRHRQHLPPVDYNPFKGYVANRSVCNMYGPPLSSFHFCLGKMGIALLSAFILALMGSVGYLIYTSSTKSYGTANATATDINDTSV